MKKVIISTMGLSMALFLINHIFYCAAGLKYLMFVVEHTIMIAGQISDFFMMMGWWL